MAQFSLCWDIQKNICQGLSSLQQNGEFVDMTLAADGHMVKVHQMVMALASPYFKELITSADAKYPVIFLNKVSYTSLCSLLEYVYTGEVLVAAEHLKEFIEAAKALHIRGIVDMTVQQSADTSSLAEEDEEVLFEVGSTSQTEDNIHDSTIMGQHESMAEESQPDADDTHMITETTDENCSRPDNTMRMRPSLASDQMMQFTVSNRGSLQMILNRYMYFVKHTNKHSTQWRCVDYVSKQARCPAYIITEDNMVVKRVGVHTHPFHDLRILKKLRVGAVYSAIQEAEQEGNIKKQHGCLDGTEEQQGDNFKEEQAANEERDEAENDEPSEGNVPTETITGD